MQEDSHADVEPIEGDGQASEPVLKNIGPPKATLARRSQSYSDFHDAVRAVLSNDVSENEGSKRPKCTEDIKNNIDFVDWYHELEQDLLDASHDEYRYVPSQLAEIKLIIHLRSR